MKLAYPWVRNENWRGLSGVSVKVFIELRSRFNGGNNGKLYLSYQEASDLLKIGKTTAKRAFDELEARGWLVKTRAGQWYGRLATLWRITSLACDGSPETNDWKNWSDQNQKAVS